MFIVENWGWPQWVFIALILYSLGANAAYSGKTYKRGSFGVALVVKIIATAILICGGFYRAVSWPQVVWTVLAVIDLGCSYKMAGQEGRYSLSISLISTVLTMFILTMGGFFA